MPPSVRDFERAARELRRLDRRNGWLLRTYCGCDFPEFVACLQDRLDAATNYEFLSRLTHAMLKVVSALRVEGD
ncbi:MAG TPA: hypothetical protein VMT05_07160 [Terriglobales bacterium]|jgi:hypothetical protein|nr:hypothetical protein [Terriglobales bacterium]